MVTGWRRAFCTSIPKDREPKVSTQKHNHHQHCDDNSNITNNRSPKISSKFGFFSNPSTPRLQSQPVSSPSLRCRTTAAAAAAAGSTTPTTARTPNSSVPNSPKLQCHVTPTPNKNTHNNNNNNNSPRLFNLSNPSSPKSSSSFSLLKLRVLSKTRCGICLQSVKAGQGTAIFTAECSHSFHFPCIASQVKKSQVLVCPVCSAAWKELPLLSIHHHGHDEASKLKDVKTTGGKTLRVYDDDEPLMSPTSGARFNPIPENEEEGDEECNGVASAEFRGFFATAASAPRLVEESGSWSARSVEVRLLPDAAIVALGRRYETYAVVMKVKAPAVGGEAAAAAMARRAPIDLVAVVDVGAGMSGARIQMARRAMRLVVSSLGSSDRLSIVAFSTASKRLLPLRRMTCAGKRSARRIADALCAVNAAGQAMSIGDAVKKAAKVLEDRRERNPAATIILLSDQTRPIVSSTRLSSHLLDVPVHAVGLGEPSSDDALAKRVVGLLSVVVQDLRLQLCLAAGSAPAEIAAVYSLTNRPAALGCGSLRLGDLHAEEEREFLLELRVPTCSAGSHHVLSVRSTHRDPSAAASSTELVCSREQPLLVPRPQAVRSSPSIERLRNLHVATRAVAESRRLVDHGDLSGARHLLSSARALLSQSKSASADEFSSGLEAELADLHRLTSQQRTQRNNNNNNNNRTDEKPEPLTPTSAWRAAERLAKVAIMRKSMNRVSDLHGFENARF